VIIPFDFLKKVILKTPEFWQKSGSNKGGVGLSAHLAGSYSSGAAAGGMSEIVSTVFSFKDFFKAFKIIAKLGYRNLDDTTQAKFNRLTSQLQKQLETYLSKN